MFATVQNRLFMDIFISSCLLLFFTFGHHKYFCFPFPLQSKVNSIKLRNLYD